MTKRANANARKADMKCNVAAEHDDEWVCVKPKDHDGPHQSERVLGGTVALWVIENDVERGEIRSVGTNGKVGGLASGWSSPVRPIKGTEAVEPNRPACGKPSRHGGPCILDPDHVGRGERHDNGQFTWALRGKEASAPTRAPASSGSKSATIGGYATHPAADLYPMLEPNELAALSEDIAVNGLEDDIILTPEKPPRILDGRNRLTACLMAKVKPRFKTYDGKIDMDSLVSFVESKNDKRRHLTASKRGIIAAKAARLRNGERPVGDAADKQTQANAAKSKQVSVRTVGYGRVVIEKGIPQIEALVLGGKLAIDAAAHLAQQPKSEQVAIAKRLEKKSGEVRSGHVRALIKQNERRRTVAKINAQQVRSVLSLEGPFGVALWDPSWKYKNSDGHAGARGHTPYPPMDFDDIVALGRQVLTRMREDAIHIIWATNPLMPLAVHLVEELGLEWQSMGTWVKARDGMGPTNFRSRTEHYIIATSGKPVHTLNEVSSWLGGRPLDIPEHVKHAERHSVKPTELHELIEKHCAGPYLELFARDTFSDKWQVWGAETDKLSRAA